MENKPYPEDFWKFFDQAMASAQETQLWNDCQNNIDSTVTASGLSNEAEEIIFTSYNDQFTLTMLYLYKLCKES